MVTQLFYMEGYSKKEIAGLLRVPVTTVNNRLHSSRRRMRPSLLPLREFDHRETDGRASNMLTYATTRRTLLRGDVAVTIRAMGEGDLPAMRRLDDEITAGLDFANAQRSPGSESYPGGPWSQEDWLRAHFARYQATGNLTLLAEDSDRRIVGFADLWATEEPEPFGRSLCVEVIDYLWEYHALGLGAILLQEAERVASMSGWPALDTRADVADVGYAELRSLGLRVFYESDRVACQCAQLRDAAPPKLVLLPNGDFDATGLLRVNHWAPTDFYFDFTHEPGRPPAHELSVGGHRVVADFWRLWEEGQQTPIGCELFVPPQILRSQALMTRALKATATIAASLGADEQAIPYPSALPLDASLPWVGRREFEWAWMRKRVD